MVFSESIVYLKFARLQCGLQGRAAVFVAEAARLGDNVAGAAAVGEAGQHDALFHLAHRLKLLDAHAVHAL